MSDVVVNGVGKIVRWREKKKKKKGGKRRGIGGFLYPRAARNLLKFAHTNHGSSKSSAKELVRIASSSIGNSGLMVYL